MKTRQQVIMGIQTSKKKRLIRRIFGTSATAIYIENDECLIHYRFSPVLGLFPSPISLTKFERELGHDLSDKIREFYGCDETFSNVHFLIFGAFRDTFGNIYWSPVVSFDFPKYIYYLIDWKVFFKDDLLKKAQNVTRFLSEG